MRFLRHPVVLASAAGILLALALLAAWAVRLDRELAETWTARKWNVPSRVFSAPLRLYPGMALAEAGLEEALPALGYRERSGSDGAFDSASGGAFDGVAAAEAFPPGTYARTPGRLLVHLHDFDYPEGPRPGYVLEIRSRNARIASLRDLSRGRELPTARLEPEEVAAIFDARMERRTPVELAAVPPVLIKAVLAVEDRRFYAHEGLDPRRIRAAALANLGARRYAQGGSTLTQQLIKNYYLHHEKSLARKAKEAAMAVLFERRHSKEEILEAYLNEVYLGQDGAASIAGVEEAARHYFSRGVSQLELPEAALLAGLVRAPGTYDPARHPERARTRRATVLGLMVAQGRISEEEAARARRAPLPPPRRARPLDGAPYFTDFALRELRDRFSRDALTREGYRIFTTLDPRAQRAAERAVAEGLAELDGPASSDSEDPGARAQAALVVLDPRTGELRALIGGRDWRASQFNRVVQARRQPGSLFKPFVYLAALADGERTLASPVADTALSVTVAGRAWAPRNHDGVFHGTVTLREALEGSYNVATARLALDVGLERVAETARRVGIRSDLRPVPSLALGAFEVTPLEMATAYGTLAAGGVRAAPRSILEVVTPEGEILAAHDLRVERRIAEGPAFLVTRALQGVVERGTAARAAALGYRGRAAGKTGTTNDSRDAWFVGYTPELLALAWVGFDDNRPLGRTGAQAALPIWTRFMRGYAAAGGAADFVPPPDVVELEVDAATGLLAHPSCGPSRPEAFLVGTEPSESCRERRRPWWWIF